MSPDPSLSSSSEVASLLAGLLDEPLVVADVGCRWGFADTWEQLGGRCRAIGFEPDERECEQLRERYHDRPWVEIVAKALGRTAGPATLYITREPACSSLYRPLDDVVDRHPRLETQRLADRERIELVTLDDWRADHGVDRIDLVKLDTQGSELDVLRGAARTLERVVAVQTEVEFNRMYEAQPLFGDLDGFLRDHGFVLWHLENLCHHRQRGARSGLRRGNQLFDFDAVRFSRRAGQLFWADALFVRADVARPDPATPWPEVLRHACLTAALGLDDLAGLVLDLHHRKLEGTTREVVETARTLLPESDHETEWVTSVVALEAHDEPPSLDAPAGGMLEEDVVVELGGAIDGAGFREPDRFGSALGRWTGPGNRAWVDVPLRMPAGAGVEVVVGATFDWQGYASFGVDVNDVPLDLEQVAFDGGFLLTGTVPTGYDTSRQFTRISIRTPEPLPRIGNPDPRKLGLGITEIRLRAPRPDVGAATR
jgi:FkbM family methyltransferase